MADGEPHSESTAPTPGTFEHPGDPAPPRLTPGQRGTLQALLHRVAQVVERYEQARGEPLEERLEFLHPDPPLTPAERARLDPLMLELTRAANALACAAAVAPSRRDRRAQLRGEFSVLWSDAEDTSVHRLEAYGPVSSAARAALTPTIARLIHATNALAIQATRPSIPPDRDPG